MKYARIDIETIGIIDKNQKTHLNFGDHLQNIVIKKLYEKMEIPNNDIYVLNYNEISNYDGEYLVLPINQAISRGVHKFFSPKIIPVFIGLSRDSAGITEDEIDYLKKYEPIGCRDEATFNALRVHNVKCYLNGCITATLEKREQEPKSGKIYIIEVPEFALQAMPLELKKEALYLENSVYITPSDIFKNTSVEKYIFKRYLELKKNAKLVITSRMHIASPCMAMGIPVILIRNNIDYRFSWLDKFLPLYTPNNIKDIDWYPKTFDFEQQKELIQNFVCNRIQNVYKEYYGMYSISEFYEARKKSNYDLSEFSKSVIDFVKKTWSKQEHWKYSFWGENDASERLYDYISKEYPNAEYIAFYDTYRNLNYHGRQRVLPEKIDPNANEFIFVTGYTATDAAQELFEKIGKPRNSYFLFKDVVRGYI